MAGLLDFLLGNDNSPIVSPNTPPPIMQPSQGGLQALTNPPAPLPAAHPALAPMQPAPSSQASQPPIVVPGQALHPDDWQPHKAGVLGQIADYFLGTHFGKENERRNEAGAMEHITSNPREAIQRMMKFNPHAAEALWNQVSSDEDRDQTNSRLRDLADLKRDQAVYGMVGNMMNSAKDQPSYTAMRDHALAYATAHNVDLSDQLPEEYDPLNADAFANGVMPVAKQRVLDERTRHDKVNENLGYGNLGERGRHDRAVEGIGEQNVGLRAQSNGIAQQNADAHTQSVATQAGRHGHADQGTLPNGDKYAITDDGQHLIRRRGGQAFHYIRGKAAGGKIGWVLVGPIKGTELPTSGDNNDE